MMLRMERLTRRFGGFTAVSDLSLEVPITGLTGLIGPNGAGKSTLFSILTGFIAPNRGHVRFDGRDLTQLPPEGRARAGLARSFQVPQEFTHMTVRENLAVAVPDQPGEHAISLFLRPVRVRRREGEVARRVEEALDLVSLRGVADQKAGTLSGGQRKLLEFGRLVLAQPRMMLLDEPFAGVNPVLIERISALIRELHGRGIGFLIVEHNLAALSRLVDMLHVMDRGTILASGPPDTVLSDPAVHTAYLGGTL
jgi:branched-chain amino acid transport system ATP-binding protein